jgi:CDP-diglyceride synthetase
VITRVITGCVLLPLLTVLIWFPQFDWPFTVAIAVLAGIGLYEYYGMVRRRPVVPETVGGILAGACVVLIAQTHAFAATAFALYAACLFIATIHVLRTEYSLEGLATSCCMECPRSGRAW